MAQKLELNDNFNQKYFCCLSINLVAYWSAGSGFVPGAEFPKSSICSKSLHMVALDKNCQGNGK